jgi:hypothetical protein
MWILAGRAAWNLGWGGLVLVLIYQFARELGEAGMTGWCIVVSLVLGACAIGYYGTASEILAEYRLRRDIAEYRKSREEK